MSALRVVSPDGTIIACESGGAGPALVLVHGSGGTGAQFVEVCTALEDRFRVIAMDRRGHGASGDASAYDLSREGEDIAAVLTAVGGGDVVAHSYGGLCALRAALDGAAVRRLVLYEAPVVTAAGAYFPDALIPAMRAAVDAGDGEAAVAAFARIVRGATEAQVTQMRRMPGWDDRVAQAAVLLRELEAVDRFRLDGVDFARWTMPTLLLRGEHSAADYVATAAALEAAMPGSRTAILSGQAHGAIEAAPAAFADVVLEFLA